MKDIIENIPDFDNPAVVHIEKMKNIIELEESVAGVDTGQFLEDARARRKLIKKIEKLGVSEEEFLAHREERLVYQNRNYARMGDRAGRLRRWNSFMGEIVPELKEILDKAEPLVEHQTAFDKPKVNASRVNADVLLKNEYGLTVAEEKFVGELIAGKSKSEAYLTAFPARRDWTKAQIASEASRLFRQPHIKARVKMIIDEATRDATTKAAWSRDDAVYNLKLTVETTREERERVKQAYEDLTDFNEKLIDEVTEELNAELEKGEYASDRKVETLKKKLNDLTGKMLKANTHERIKKNTSEAHSRAIEALNIMHGFNEVKIDLNSAVSFVGEDELED